LKSLQAQSEGAMLF